MSHWFFQIYKKSKSQNILTVKFSKIKIKEASVILIKFQQLQVLQVLTTLSTKKTKHVLTNF